jgi:hypothetical protein
MIFGYARVSTAALLLIVLTVSLVGCAEKWVKPGATVVLVMPSPPTGKLARGPAMS